MLFLFMLLFSLLLIKSYQAQCTAVHEGAAGTCAICDQATGLCQTCNYADQYQPNQEGTCSPRPPSKCIPIANGEAGSCQTCDTTKDVCQVCNYADKYEPNENGNCSLKVPKCTPVTNGAAGTCSVCNETADVCQTCNYPDKYEPNEHGNCSIIVKKCVPISHGAAGSCEVCNEAADVCQTCNYPNKYEPNEFGNCSLKQLKCTPVPNGADGTCSVCNETSDLCQTCNHPELYEPNELGNCTLKQLKCKPVAGGPDGTCLLCNESDLCQVCNHPELYEPNEFGNCTLRPKKCTAVPNGANGTCSVCNETTDLCEVCNYPELYEPNEFGNCTLRQCVEIQLGAAGTCSICNKTTNLCEVCNYPNTHEPNQFGNCSVKPYTKCINVTDGAAGTCGQCDNATNLCTYCNYPDIFEPDQHGGCQMKPQAQCTSVPYGPGGTCSVCNLRSHLCEICNYPGQWAPSPFGNCSLKQHNGCSELVTNCYKCDKHDSTKCVECQYGYGLRGGFCTKCGNNLYEDSRHPCLPDCSAISDCRIGRRHDIKDACKSENGEVYCVKCNYGFHPSDDYQTCIANVPGNCSIPIPGCLECSYNGSTKCTKCDTEKNFILDREDGECECRRGYEYVLGECLRVKEVKCDKSLHKCDKCAFNSTTCIECDDDYGLENGTCVKCEKGGYVGGEFPCLKPCTSIPNCRFCSEDGSYCFKCESHYEHTDDHSKCYSEESGNCNSNVTGCLKCSQSDPSFCLKCDKKNHFDESDVFEGTCVCDEDYDFVDGQCVEPFSPVLPPQPVEPKDQFQIDNVTFPQYVDIIANTIYQILANASFTPGTMYILFVPISIRQIMIPRGPTYFQLTIPQPPSTGEGVTVDADPSTQVDLSCPNGANIIIPGDNKNYVFKGSGLITIDPAENTVSSVFVRKITLDQSGNSMRLHSRRARIIVSEIEIYGIQVITGQSENYTTSVENATIQSGSSFTPENITLKTLKIGIQSVLYVRGNRGVAITNFNVYYNSTTVNKVPIQFTSPFPDLSQSRLQMVGINQGAQIQEGESFTVASFQGENSKQACESLKLNPGEFNDAECVTQGTTTVMVAKKAAVDPSGPDGENPKKKKNGLSAGAIAGIVVGCVVAVGLVVFLCVWFLVVKKKAIPAHPRSGEPAGSREKLEI